MAAKPPVWIRDLLAEKVSGAFGRVVTPTYRDKIDRWLRTFTIDEPVLEPLGGGHFGYAYRIRKGSRGGMRLMKGEEDPTGLVFKVTRDPTEGPFCRWIHEEQEKGNSLFQGAFARMYDVRTIPTVVPWRGKDWPVYFIVREEVAVPGTHIDEASEVVVPGEVRVALQYLQVSGRQLVKPRKRGHATVTKAVHRGGVYLGHQTLDAAKVWEDAIAAIEKYQEFIYIWTAFWQLRTEYDLYLQDVHANNVGKRIAMPGDDWSGAEDYWVIFDPGHTPTNQGLAIDRLENPCHGVRVPRLR